MKSIVPSALAANDGASITVAGDQRDQCEDCRRSWRRSAIAGAMLIASVANSSGHVKM